MYYELNTVEKNILERVAVKYPVLVSHISYLLVKERVCTGVGMYVYFIYDNGSEKLPLIEPNEIALSTNEVITMRELKHGLVFEVVISSGRVSFIEFVTLGNDKWNGEFTDLNFKRI